MANVTDTYALSVIREVHVTSRDIDDIMVMALDSIGYWCDRIEVLGEQLGRYASDQISRGGSIILHDAESGDKWELTLDKFLHGVELALEQGVGIGLEVTEGLLYICDFDEYVTDVIVQLALFGKVVFS